MLLGIHFAKMKTNTNKVQPSMCCIMNRLWFLTLHTCSIWSTDILVIASCDGFSTAIKHNQQKYQTEKMSGQNNIKNVIWAQRVCLNMPNENHKYLAQQIGVAT